MHREVWLLAERVELDGGGVVRLSDAESRHAAGPLRLRPGDRVVLTDGYGRTADAILRVVASRGCEAEIVAARAVPRPSIHAVTIALSVLHGRAMDWAIQKLVELGVGILIPVCAQRSQLGLSAARGRRGHWRRVAWQALKQCHRSWALEIADPVSVGDLVVAWGDAGGLVAGREGRPIDTIDGDAPPRMLVGPEGGFTAKENDVLAAARWPRVRLGRFVLRAETAAVVGAAMLAARGDTAS